MLRMQIVIPGEAVQTLYELAEQERRTPRDQAALLLTEVLRRRQQQARRRRVPHRELEAARAS